jgi:hypothetical protein
MTIEEYSFGKMVIDRTIYKSDLMIFGEEVRSDWWRKEGHSLCVQDLEWLLSRPMKRLIIGTGKFGRMKIPEVLTLELSQRGIEIEGIRTSKAIDRFNHFVKENPDSLGGAFHLTC